MPRHRKAAARPLLRLAGLALLLLAYGTGRALLAIGTGHAGHEPPSAYLLAAIAFACASAGSALLIHGHHLFDPVPISRLWQTPAARHSSDAREDAQDPRRHLQDDP